jgi:endonuclease/exonuclease/phosphatase family metal-dependent hydrolase
MSSSPYRLEALFRKMIGTNIDILLIQEINTNIRNPIFKKLLRKTVSHYNNLQSVWSQISLSHRVLNQPGGMAIFIKHPFSKYINQRIIDPLGRWAGVTLRIKRAFPLTIILTYQPTKHQNPRGYISLTAQQLQVIQDRGSNLSVKQQYKNNICDLMTNLKQQQHNIILAADFNKHNQVDNVLQTLSEKFQMIEVKALQNANYTTYCRSSNTIDRVIITSGLFPLFISSTLEEKDSLVTSDHFPIRFVMNINIEEHAELSNCHLTSNHMHKVTKYS